jgi:hypothetical protein
MLKEWAQRFHLTQARDFEEQTPFQQQHDPDDDVFELQDLKLDAHYWACQWAVQTLWQWRFTDLGPKLLTSNPPKWVQGSFRREPRRTDSPPFTLKQAGWDPAIEHESGFRARITKALAESLNNQIAVAKIAAQELGLEPAPSKKRDHFDWFALFQVNEWAFPRIADWYQARTGCALEDDAIRHGVCDVAECVALPRRQAKRGRPKKPEI